MSNFNTIRDQCLKDGVLFEDPDFHANDKSLSLSISNPQNQINWLRPTEIVDNPKFFVDGFSRFDVEQGELGDCWLLAAIANLTTNARLFQRVVPVQQLFEKDYAGIFYFRFWQYGEWIEVVIDDKLPTNENKKLIYMNSPERTEFWSALFEKAYAKLHGSYGALDGGSARDAFIDFTGGVTELYNLKNAPRDFFNHLIDGYDRNSLISCCITPSPKQKDAKTKKGLIKGHAYSVTKIMFTNDRSSSIRLLRLRNPWGHSEWNGDYSDNSEKWKHIPDEIKNEINFKSDVDGEFWMCYDDFLMYFHLVEICNLSPDSLLDEQFRTKAKCWEASVFDGKWILDKNAGGCLNYPDTFSRNPKYNITLEKLDKSDKKCTLIVALMQKYRKSQNKDMLPIGFYVFDMNGKKVAESSKISYDREVTDRFKLPPGDYQIIPTTFYQNQEGEFLLRIFSDSKNNMKLDDSIIKGVPVRIEIKTKIDLLHDASEKAFIDIVGDRGVINWKGLKEIFDRTIRYGTKYKEIPKDICRTLIAMEDRNQDGKINLENFRILLEKIKKWYIVFASYDHNYDGSIYSAKLKSVLKQIGYDLSAHICNCLVHRYADDYKIELNDFIRCTMKVDTMINRFNEDNLKGTDSITINLHDWIGKTVYS